MEKQVTAYLMVGIPGSGKSTWVRENLPDSVITISRDNIRHELGFTAGVDDKAVLSRENERKVTDVEYDIIRHYIKNGFDVVIDDTNTSKYRKSMVDFIKSCGARVVAVKMNTPIETCIQRREGQIPTDIMQRIHDNQVNLNPEEVDEIIEIG